MCVWQLGSETRRCRRPTKRSANATLVPGRAQVASSHHARAEHWEVRWLGTPSSERPRFAHEVPQSDNLQLMCRARYSTNVGCDTTALLTEHPYCQGIGKRESDKVPLELRRWPLSCGSDLTCRPDGRVGVSLEQSLLLQG